jgi:hypothetical protein
MIDPRNLDQITQAHPVPWRFMTTPGFQQGGARIVCVDAAGKEVLLSVMMRVVDIVTTKIATQPQPQSQPQ